MSDVLAKICADKRKHIARRKAEWPLAEIEKTARHSDAPRGFARALRSAREEGRYGLIAEIKKASPSKGLIREDFDPPSLARAYHAGGATCLSVLTDEPYFQGKESYLQAARDVVPLPALRKDFMLDPYQVAEARALGADCILLIMAALTDREALDLNLAARDWGMDVLVEVHDRDELDRALSLEPEMIGINNRNLKTMAVDLATTEELAPAASTDDRLVVCESGLSTPADLARMAAIGVTTFLIGESFMRQDDVAKAVRTMLAQPVTA